MRDFVHRAEYAAYHVVAGTTQRLPLRALRAWARAVGRLAYHLLARRRALTLENLARALPELDAAERRRVASRCFEVQSETYHEQVWAMRRGAEIAERFEIVGREHFESARARGKGVFVLTGHYGCWELAGYPLGRWLGTLYIVARPQNNPYIAAHFERLRESNGNVQIDRDRAGTRMLKVLKKGGAIGVAIDQRVRPSQALLVPFLGRYAWTSRLPAYLATVTGCAAVPMVCVPLPDGRYRMTFDAPILPQGGGDDEIERLTRHYAAALEPHIRARPELWLWMHSRWQRTRKQRRPEAIAKLVEEAGLDDAPPLRAIAQRALAGSAMARLITLATDDFVENARHLLVVVPDGANALVLAAFSSAVARLGHPTRWLSLRELCERLGAARGANRLDAELRELDRISLIAIHSAPQEGLDPDRLDLLGHFLRHRQDRGSVALADGVAKSWRSMVEPDGAISAFLDACEVIDLSALDPGTFTSSLEESTPRTASSGETEPPALRV
ncbi:MAG TPA: ATP-binding protein [Thermoanaerobaculia bacterium]|nr:ATP-binding protein [Thermoanaerobaculia bacterium]